LNRQSLIRYRHITAATRRDMACIGFRMIGDMAKPATSALLQLTVSSDREVRLDSLRAFLSIDPDKELFLPELVKLVKDRDPVVREAAVINFWYHYPQDAKKLGVPTAQDRIADGESSAASTNLKKNIR
jgi:hypothetical protein